MYARCSWKPHLPLYIRYLFHCNYICMRERRRVRPASGLVKRQNWSGTWSKPAVRLLVICDDVPPPSGQSSLRISMASSIISILNLWPQSVGQSSLLLQENGESCGAFQCSVPFRHCAQLCWWVLQQRWQVLALASAVLCQGWFCLHSRQGVGLCFPNLAQKPVLSWLHWVCFAWAACEGWEFGSWYLSGDKQVWCWNLASVRRLGVKVLFCSQNSRHNFSWWIAGE